METIIKGTMGIFLSVIMLLIGVQFLTASLQARKAQLFMTEVTERISASHFSKGVIEACRKDAKEAGYDLQLQIMGNEATKAYYGNATMEYDFTLPLFGIDKKHRLQADVR